MIREKKLDLAALASIPLVMTLANSMLIPVLPFIQKEINISSFQSSMIITVYSIASILLIPAAGFLSDRYGRKKIMIPSLIIAGIGGLISGLAAVFFEKPYAMLLTGRVIQGIGASGAFPVVIPTVGDMFQDEKDISKGLGIIETSNTFGKVVSPVLGSALGMMVWFAPFLSIPVISAVSAVLIQSWVKTGRKDDQKNLDIHGFLRNLKAVFKKKWRWLSATFFVGLVCMFILFGFLFYISSILEDVFGINGIIKGLILAVPLLFLCTASLMVGNNINANKKRMKWIIFIGLLIAVVTLPLIGYLSGLVLMMAIITVSGTGLGATLPCLDSLITEGIQKENRGTISSFFSGARLLGVASGPPIVAILMNTGSKLTFIVLSAAGVMAALATLFFIKPDHIPQKANAHV